MFIFLAITTTQRLKVRFICPFKAILVLTLHVISPLLSALIILLTLQFLSLLTLQITQIKTCYCYFRYYTPYRTWLQLTINFLVLMLMLKLQLLSVLSLQLISDTTQHPTHKSLCYIFIWLFTSTPFSFSFYTDTFFSLNRRFHFTDFFHFTFNSFNLSYYYHIKTFQYLQRHVVYTPFRAQAALKLSFELDCLLYVKCM